MVLRCQRGRVQIVFEAGGESVAATYSEPGNLAVNYPLWLPEDGHADPTRLVEARYQWDDARGRFFLVNRSERSKAHK